jgi:hypothetical protein
VTDLAYDTEFLEDGKSIDLISIGMVRADGAEYYAVNSDANWARISTQRWLCENVVPYLPLMTKGVRKATPGENTNVASSWKFALDLTDTRVKPAWVIANEVREFILAVDDPKLWADHAAYDHVVLAWLWGSMMQLPAGIPMWTHDLRQEIERAGNPQIPAPGGIVQPAHHALGDAREVMHRLNWLREHAA